MIQDVINTISKYEMINQNDHIVLGLSGGADSVSLLYVLLDLKEIYGIEITAVHVNHLLRGEESKRDEEFVKKLCNTLNVNLEVVKYPILEKSKELKLSVEEAGRLIRYRVFQKVLKNRNANKIAVAHNNNDQAETLLMNFFRGSGLKGLGGIPAVRGNIVRPLIKCSRQLIEEYCKNNNINYIFDSSNSCLDYTRNKVRLKLLPYIVKEFNSNIVDTLSRSAEIFSMEDDYINIQSLEAYKHCVISKDGIEQIDIDKFLKLHQVLQRRIIRIIFLNYTNTLKNFSSKHINMVLLLTKNKTGKSINLPHGLKAQRSYTNLCIFKPQIHKDYIYKITIGSFIYIKEFDIYISCQQKKILSKEGFINTCNEVFNYDKIKSDIILRNRKPGDKIYLKSIGNKKIKDYFINKKISRNERDNIPMLLDNKNVIWILPYPSALNHQAISHYFCAENTDINKVYIQLWRKTNER